MPRKSHYGSSARLLDNPLGLTAKVEDSIDRSTEKDGGVESVNPLWMITAGLAAFLLLLVAVW